MNLEGMLNDICVNLWAKKRHLVVRSRVLQGGEKGMEFLAGVSDYFGCVVLTGDWMDTPAAAIENLAQRMLSELK